MQSITLLFEATLSTSEYYTALLEGDFQTNIFDIQTAFSRWLETQFEYCKDLKILETTATIEEIEEVCLDFPDDIDDIPIPF